MKIKPKDWAIAAVFISFLIAYLGVSYYNRIQQDDFNNYFRTKSEGVIGATLNYYNHFEGALVWYWWVSVVPFLFGYSTHIFLINLFNLVFFSGSLFLLLSIIIKKFLD